MINPRIIAGKYKNRVVTVPESARPITDRVKRVLFDTLTPVLEDAIVLDLFAGSGNIGIEAVSRGAAFVSFVENNADAIKIIKKNTQTIVENENCYDIYSMGYGKFLALSTNTQYSLIIIDPPFALIPHLKLDSLAKKLSNSGIVVIKVNQENKKIVKIPTELELVDEKKVGINILIFLKLDSSMSVH